MRRRIAMFLCVSLLICMVVGCGSPKEPGRYYDKSKGFSIKFPEGWTKTKSLFGVTVTFTDPEGRVKLGVQCQTLASGKTFEELIKAMRGFMQKQGFKIIAESETVIDGVDGYWFSAQQGTIAISYYIVIKGQDSYAMMATYDKDSTNQDIEDVIESSVATFKFLK